MIDKYGEPSSIVKHGKITESNYERNELGYGISKKYELEETKINENPMFITWNNDKDHISITNNYINKITKIQFSLTK